MMEQIVNKTRKEENRDEIGDWIWWKEEEGEGGDGKKMKLKVWISPRRRKEEKEIMVFRIV